MQEAQVARTPAPPLSLRLVPNVDSQPPASQPSLSLEALNTLAADLDLTTVPHRVALHPKDDPREPRHLQLIATGACEAWLTTWPPGTSRIEGGHDGETSVVRVLSGSMIQSDGTDHRQLSPGESVVVRPLVPHRLCNVAGVEATTLHVLTTC
jgi:quercetin dioxygenase-like cupin family protein